MTAGRDAQPELAALRAALDRLEGCRTHGCAVAPPRGQGLNGRCRCELPPGVGPALSAARRLVAELERDAGGGR